jgi:hypothetical protein
MLAPLTNLKCRKLRVRHRSFWLWPRVDRCVANDTHVAQFPPKLPALLARSSELQASVAAASGRPARLICHRATRMLAALPRYVNPQSSNEFCLVIDKVIQSICGNGATPVCSYTNQLGFHPHTARITFPKGLPSVSDFRRAVDCAKARQPNCAFAIQRTDRPAQPR